jgi:predicted transcriptional regulator
MLDRGKRQYRDDIHCRKILLHCFECERTANFLSMKLNLPIAVCISKLRYLEDCGLLVKERKVRTSQGKWVQLYRSLVREAGRIESIESRSGKEMIPDLSEVVE